MSEFEQAVLDLSRRIGSLSADGDQLWNRVHRAAFDAKCLLDTNNPVVMEASKTLLGALNKLEDVIRDMAGASINLYKEATNG